MLERIQEMVTAIGADIISVKTALFAFVGSFLGPWVASKVKGAAYLLLNGIRFK